MNDGRICHVFLEEQTVLQRKLAEKFEESPFVCWSHQAKDDFMPVPYRDLFRIIF
jgi:hypothetical protein